jgi:hypothetical protein
MWAAIAKIGKVFTTKILPFVKKAVKAAPKVMKTVTRVIHHMPAPVKVMAYSGMSEMSEKAIDNTIGKIPVLKTLAPVANFATQAYFMDSLMKDADGTMAAQMKEEKAQKAKEKVDKVLQKAVEKAMKKQEQQAKGKKK